MKIDDYKSAIESIPKSRKLKSTALNAVKTDLKPARTGFIRTAVCVCSVIICVAAVIGTVWYNVSKLNSDGGIVQSSPTTTTATDITQAPATETDVPQTSAPELIASTGFIRIGNVIYYDNASYDQIDKEAEYSYCGKVASINYSDTISFDNYGDMEVNSELSLYLDCDVFVTADNQYAYIEKDNEKKFFASWEWLIDDEPVETDNQMTEAVIYRVESQNSIQKMNLYGTELEQLENLENGWSQTLVNTSDCTYMLVINGQISTDCVLYGGKGENGNELIEKYWNNNDNQKFDSCYAYLNNALDGVYALEPFVPAPQAIEIFRADGDNDVKRVIITDKAEIEQFIADSEKYKTENYSDSGSIAYMVSVRYLDEYTDYYFDNTYYGNDIFVSGADYYGNAEIEKLFNSKTAYECGELDYNIAIQKTKDVKLWNLGDYRDGYYVKQFLDAFMQGDTDKMATLTGAFGTDCYSDFKGVKLDSYAFKELIIGEYSVTYKVELNISESDNPQFPVGKFLWIAAGPDGTTGNVSEFRRADTIPKETESELVRFCYDFTNQLSMFDTCDDFTKYLKNGDYSHSILHLLEPIFTENYTVEYETAADYLNTHYGIDYRQIAESRFYDAENSTLVMCSGHGGKWLYFKPLDTTTNVDGTQSVEIEYYADTCKLVAAKRVKYTVMTLDEGFKLISTECTYDSGYPVLLGSI